MKRMPAAYKRVLEMAAARRAERNAALARRGLTIVDRRDLRPGDIVVNVTDEQPWYTVRRIQPAVAKHYIVIDGVSNDNPHFRTSGHVLDDVLIKTRQ